VYALRWRYGFAQSSITFGRFTRLGIALPHQLNQLGDVRRNPPRLILAEQLGR
jgi:hypothetical protein